MIKLVTTRPDHYDWDYFADREELQQFIASVDLLPFDTETTGLSFMDDDLVSWQVGNEEVQYVVDQKTVPVALFKKELTSKTLLGQNLAFDLTFLYKEGIVCKDIQDTLTAEILLSLGLQQHKRGYGALVERHLGVELDKSVQKTIAQTGLTREAIQYAGDDVKYLLPLYRAQMELIKKQGMGIAYRLENRFTPVMAYMEFCGIYIDTDEWYNLVRRIEYEEYGAELALNEYIEPYGVGEINWASSKQVEELFRTEFDIDTFSKKLRRATVDAGHLLAQKHDIIPLYLDYKQKAKAVSTYGRPFLDYPKSDKRIHTKFKQLVSTGRMSSGDRRVHGAPNIQNLPADENYRKCFKGQGPNRLIVCDYSAQEGVILADVSQEPNMLKFYQEGGDIHCYVAKQIWPELRPLDNSEIKEQHNEKRNIAKTVGFSVAYGGSAFTIASNLNIPTYKAKIIYNAYMDSFPTLGDYFDKVSGAAKNNGYILLHEKTGHKRFIGGWDEWKGSLHQDKKFEGMMYRQALNTPIQARAAMMTKLAAIYLFDWILDNKRFGKVKLVNMIHDELVVEVHQRKAEEMALVVQDCMVRAGEYILDTLPIKAEPNITKEWTK